MATAYDKNGSIIGNFESVSNDLDNFFLILIIVAHTPFALISYFLTHKTYRYSCLIARKLMLITIKTPSNYFIRGYPAYAIYNLVYSLFGPNVSINEMRVISSFLAIIVAFVCRYFAFAYIYRNQD